MNAKAKLCATLQNACWILLLVIVFTGCASGRLISRGVHGPNVEFRNSPVVFVGSPNLGTQPPPTAQTGLGNVLCTLANNPGVESVSVESVYGPQGLVSSKLKVDIQTGEQTMQTNPRQSQSQPDLLTWIERGLKLFVQALVILALLVNLYFTLTGQLIPKIETALTWLKHAG